MMGMFSEFNTLVLFYSQDLMDEIGVTIPADRPLSWDEVAQISSDLRIETGAGVLERVGYQFGFYANFRSPQWYAQKLLRADAPVRSGRHLHRRRAGR